MTQKVNPVTGELMTFMPGNSEFIWTRKTGNSTLDNEDIVNNRSTHWNLKGVSNKLGAKARAMGEKLGNINSRGRNKDLYRTRAKEDCFDF